MKHFAELTDEELAEALHFVLDELWAGTSPTKVEEKLESLYEFDPLTSHRVAMIAERIMKLSE